MIWVIGDIHGCFESLQGLIKKINFNPDKDNLWFVGDLVNRGPQSLEVLEYVYELHKNSLAKVVLGNHELHLLAVAAGSRRFYSGADTYDDILQSKKLSRLIDWLRELPFVIYENKALLVHAGIPPQIGLTQVMNMNDYLQKEMMGNRYLSFIKAMYGDFPSVEERWSSPNVAKSLDISAFRYAINALTRMRLCDENGKLYIKYSGPAKKIKTFSPWYLHPNRKIKITPVFFGHWSVIGVMNYQNAYCLDSGCVWGRELSAMNIETKEIVSV